MQTGTFCRRLTFAAVFIAWRAAFAQTNPSPRLVETWSDVFGGTSVTFHASARADKLSWSFSVGGAVVARRDVAPAPGADVFPITVDVPDVKPGTVLDAVLALETSDGKASRRIWIFPRDPWNMAEAALKQADIRLFDPDGKTAAALDSLAVPYKTVRSAEALGEVTNGVVLVGEGLSLAENRGLAAALVKAATAGAQVICLAPREGLLELPGCADEVGAVPKPVLALRNGELITELDKRLDAAEWTDGPAVLATWHPAPERRRIEGEWRADAQGWPWISATFASGGSLTYCGFGIVRSWEKTPAARYLLDAMLKNVMADHTKGRKPDAGDRW